MATSFSLATTLGLPGAPGLSAQPIIHSFADSYTKKVEYEYDFTGAGSITVNFGSIGAPGAKLVLIHQESVAGAAPVLVRVNGAVAGDVEVSPNGLWLSYNPAAAAGVTGLVLSHTQSGRVRVWLLA